VTIGRHLILDLYGCREAGLLCSDRGLIEVMGNASRKAGASVRSIHSHEFSCLDTGEPAWSITLILEESHCCLHSWPNERFVSLDLYTCGRTDPMKALDYLLSQFQPEDYQMSFKTRGAKRKQP